MDLNKSDFMELIKLNNKVDLEILSRTWWIIPIVLVLGAVVIKVMDK